MSAAEEWEPSEYGATDPLLPPEDTEKPAQWYRNNAAVFYALEEWQGNWETHAYEYERTNGRPPSSQNREKNKAAFRRKLIDKYGRGEPDSAWCELRISHLEKRGMAPERGDRSGR